MGIVNEAEICQRFVDRLFKEKGLELSPAQYLKIEDLLQEMRAENNTRKVFKYVPIKRVSYAKKDEEINFIYPSPIHNNCGKKDDIKIKQNIQDFKDGKCKMMVWREVEETL